MQRLSVLLVLQGSRIRPGLQCGESNWNVELLLCVVFGSWDVFEVPELLLVVFESGFLLLGPVVRE